MTSLNTLRECRAMCDVCDVSDACDWDLGLLGPLLIKKLCKKKVAKVSGLWGD